MGLHRMASRQFQEMWQAHAAQPTATCQWSEHTSMEQKAQWVELWGAHQKHLRSISIAYGVPLQRVWMLQQARGHAPLLQGVREPRAAAMDMAALRCEQCM
jgi:hypothetical protein